MPGVRDRSILTGLFLSKFDRRGLDALGFGSFTEAFNVLGYSIGAKPASIKNYRDEFDPMFPNPRSGWHKRAMRDYCKKLHNEYSGLPMSEFAGLVKGFVKDFSVVEKDGDASDTVAKRLVTGRAAEQYFRQSYKDEERFEHCDMEDMTQAACGYDFKLSCPRGFYLVEVKGLSADKGTVSLTEKEFKVAESYGGKFCLFTVLNFSETPYHRAYFDPLKSDLVFKKKERKVVQISYTSRL